MLICKLQPVLLRIFEKEEDKGKKHKCIKWSHFKLEMAMISTHWLVSYGMQMQVPKIGTVISIGLEKKN